MHAFRNFPAIEDFSVDARGAPQILTHIAGKCGGLAMAMAMAMAAPYASVTNNII